MSGTNVPGRYAVFIAKYGGIREEHSCSMYFLGEHSLPRLDGTADCGVAKGPHDII